jgi:hypothetical protein
MDRSEAPAAVSAFWLCAAAAMLLHALLLFGNPALHGGADLPAHLRLIQLMGEEPALRNVYAPAYHVLGALAAPVVGLANYPKLFGLLSAAGLIASFRFFQRCAGIPVESAALYALFPYSFALSWCLPKVELAGYALALVGLGLLIRRRYLGVALVVVASFTVHTASALFLGIAGGVLALARADRWGLVALALGAVGALPLLAVHVVDGCTLSQALLLSRGDYLRAIVDGSTLGLLDVILVLASPVALALAALGAGPLWRRDRPLAMTCAALAFLYLNELWLTPLEARTTLNLVRGLSVLAIPVSVSGGLALAEWPRLMPWLLSLCLLWAGASAFLVVPRSCYVRAVEIAEVSDLRVARCMFRWKLPGSLHRRTPQHSAPR